MEQPQFHNDYNLDQVQLSILENLNDDQHRAAIMALKAKDYLLIEGMPGTGKSTTIAHIVKLLQRQGITFIA